MKKLLLTFSMLFLMEGCTSPATHRKNVEDLRAQMPFPSVIGCGHAVSIGPKSQPQNMIVALYYGELVPGMSVSFWPEGDFCPKLDLIVSRTDWGWKTRVMVKELGP